MKRAIRVNLINHGVYHVGSNKCVFNLEGEIWNTNDYKSVILYWQTAVTRLLAPNMEEGKRDSYHTVQADIGLPSIKSNPYSGKLRARGKIKVPHILPIANEYVKIAREKGIIFLIEFSIQIGVKNFWGKETKITHSDRMYFSFGNTNNGKNVGFK